MYRTFLHKAMQVFFLFALLSLKLGATEKTDIVSSAAGTHEQFTGTIDRCGEIELTGTHPFTGYSHQGHKKASLQLWCANHTESGTISGSDLYIIRTLKARSSDHLAYIYPFHYFW
jgi:hypothetical protein